jgi:hypothetical protein
MTLLELAERCEKVEAPSYDLNVSIHRVVRAFPEDWPRAYAGASPTNYTGSIDAAMTLVPEGLMVAAVKFSNGTGRSNIHDGKDVGGSGIDVRAATPALALCAAALRASAAQSKEGNPQ